MSRSSTAEVAHGADLRHATRLLAALILPIGPLAIAGVRYVLPYFDASTSPEVASAVLAAEGRQSLVLWLGFVAAFTLLPGVLAVARLTRRRAPRTTAAAVALVVPGYLAMLVMMGADLVLWTGARADLDAATLSRLADTLHPSTSIAIGIFIVGHVLGTVLLGIACSRRASCRCGPRWRRWCRSRVTSSHS